MRARLGNIRWRLSLLAGVKAPVFAALIWMALVVLYGIALAIAAQGPPDREHIGRFGRYGEWGMPVLAIVVTRFVAAATARKARAQTEAHGTIIGAISGVMILVLWLIVHGMPSLWSVAAAFLSIGAGWRGGVAARASLDRERHLYLASRAIATADNAQTVVDSVGAYLSDAPLRHVSLWTTEEYAVDGTPTTIRHRATWNATSGAVAPHDARLRNTQTNVFNDIRPETPYLFHPQDRPGNERKMWEALGFHHALLLPLIGPDDRCSAILMTDWTTERAATRFVGTVQTITAQIVLALENIRLVEQGRQVGVLEERQRLAREIHDTLAQGFTSIVMHLEAAEQAFSLNRSTALSHLDCARRTARDSLSEARHVVWALRPEVLAHSSLSEAIARVAQQWSEDSGIVVTTNITGVPRPLSTAIEATLLRAVQEALANVRKHAQAHRVVITLSFMDDRVALDVRDDGKGFEPCLHTDERYRSSGYGLMAMRERVLECGGSMLVESVPGEGTTLAIELPSVQSESLTADVAVPESI